MALKTSSTGDVLARQDGGAPAEAGRQGDLGLALVEQRVADQIVQGAVEIAAAVEQRVGLAEHLLEFVFVGRADLVDRAAVISASGAITSEKIGISL